MQKKENAVRLIYHDLDVVNAQSAKMLYEMSSDRFNQNYIIMCTRIIILCIDKRSEILFLQKTSDKNGNIISIFYIKG
jgi:hypothetical protein